MAAYSSTKVILVIGGTGAQGLAIVDKLLAPAEDGSPSPYCVRVLTRDPQSKRAQELASKGVELFKGAFDDFDSVAEALKGCYGAFVNTDGFTVGQAKEVWCGIHIYELARYAKIKHYVWSNLDYFSRITNFDPKYRCEHSDGKGIVGDFMQAQPSVVSDTDMSWTLITSGPYMEMLQHAMFGPVKQREDGTVVFVTPIGKGHVNMIALDDFGFFARYTFDHREATSGHDLQISSDKVDWEYLRTTFEKVTGKRAEVLYQSYDDWVRILDGVDVPLANERGRTRDGSITWKENFRAWWANWRDVTISRDYELLRKVNPKGHTLESWMRKEGYGKDLWAKVSFLKNAEDKKAPWMNFEYVATL
ncbi:NAD-P-binding protein [Fomitopsis serialis]|uniref:NAD-P-binding protein n=1 Tax=Fomitopsis serialis TaxID=139415 RepID=UPI002007C1E2|nr:NAD-P-binding protein [Neoantrodia serialis]XP_047886885.1 NAD-P-binding protein [Neoantrodia serialis]KAH9914600.1 NAD-P-binding protein [Neoantrodia serialis]KAH9914969.1 NAD-P-binding protein [Neoantrodia serialis]